MYSVGLLGGPCERSVPTGLAGSSSFFNKVTVKKSAFVDWALRHLAFDLSLLTSHVSLLTTGCGEVAPCPLCDALLSLPLCRERRRHPPRRVFRPNRAGDDHLRQWQYSDGRPSPSQRAGHLIPDDTGVAGCASHAKRRPKHRSKRAEQSRP